MLKQVSHIVPYASKHNLTQRVSEQTNCSCGLHFNIFNWVHFTCYCCKRPLCKNCPVKVVLFPRLADKARPLCSDCIASFKQRDVEDWTTKSVHFIKTGTLESIKTACGCLTVALCLSNFSKKPVMRVAQAFLSEGMPELAMSFTVVLLEHSEGPKETLKVYVLLAQIFKTLADSETICSAETKWNLLLAAKECCNLALETATYLDSSIEHPTLAKIQREVCNSLHTLREKQEVFQEREINTLCSKMETCWQDRNWKRLLTLVLEGDDTKVSFIPHSEDITTLALEKFLASRCKFIDKMLPDDRCGLVFLQAVIKIQKHRFADALADLETLAYDSHYQVWLGSTVADLLLGLLTHKNSLLFPAEVLNKALTGDVIIGRDLGSGQDRWPLLFPKPSELSPPFASRWPELGVVGLNTKGYVKFEKAVAELLDKGQWTEWDAALAYINYVPACIHPVEAALCFLYAAMFLLKRLSKVVGSSRAPPLSDVFATKNFIMNCLQSSMALCIRYLHPGMKLYVCRLCLGTAMQTMQLTENLAIAYEAELVTALLHLMIYSSQFCPAWHFPSIPLSEAILLDLKSARCHLKYLLNLQYIQNDSRPVSLSELHYQLHENDMRGICRLQDSAGARARAMEDMLHEKGWTWNDVVNLMTSPLSPRDCDGWLIQQKALGIPMPFAKLTGFSFNMDATSPSIEIIAIPADPANGLVGLFSMHDVQTMLQLAAADAYPIFFSLDPPNLHQNYHPFYKWRYGPKELHDSLFVHTLFETDYLLKSFSVGAEVSARPPFISRPCKEGLTKNLPSDLTEAIKPIAERGKSSQHVHRFWIQADVVEFSIRQSGSILEFELGEPKVNIRSHPITPGPDGNFRDTEFDDDPDSAEAKFASDLTAHYEQLGKYFPMFARLRELAKLQTLVPILRNIKKNMEDRANGIGLHVPDFLLTEIQEDAKLHHQERISTLLKRLDTDIGTWPIAEDQARIDLEVKHVMDNLPHRVRSNPSYTDIEPHIKTLLKEEDEKKLKDITDGLFELCEQNLSRDSLKRAVHQWLLFRNSSSTNELKNLICSAFPLPTSEDIINNLIIPDRKRTYSAFKQMLESATSPSHPKTTNPCIWVPAAAVKDEENILVNFGGVTLPVVLVQRRQQSDSDSDESEQDIHSISCVPTLREIVQRSLSVHVPVEGIDSTEYLPEHDHDQVRFVPAQGPFVPECQADRDSANLDNEASQEGKGTSYSPATDGNSDSEVNLSSRATGENHKSDSDPTCSKGSSCSNGIGSDSDGPTCSNGASYSDGIGGDYVTDDQNEPSSTLSATQNSVQQVVGNSVDIESLGGSDLESLSTCSREEWIDSDADVEKQSTLSPTVTKQTGHDDSSSDQDQEYLPDSDSPSPLAEEDPDNQRDMCDAHFTSNAPTTKFDDDQININVKSKKDTSQSVYESNPELCESHIRWKRPGYGMGVLSYYGENTCTPDKSASPVKSSHPCAMYTKLRYNCTQKKREDLLSIERSGRLRVKRLIESFNISRNISIHDCHVPASEPYESEKVGDRGSAFLSAIEKHQGWLSFAMKSHPGTAKATVAIKETNKVANANSPCGIKGCECCDAMAQSNMCVDDNSSETYRAEVTKEVNCRSSNVVYLIRCRRSGKNIHIGQTKDELHECLRQHCKREGSTVYRHFTSEGYSFEDMEVMVLADIDDDKVREKKEHEWTKKLKRGDRKSRRKK